MLKGLWRQGHEISDVMPAILIETIELLFGLFENPR